MPYRKLDQFPRSDKPCTVYLIHFSKPLKHAQHYIGVTNRDRSFSERLDEHKGGRGARICQAAVQNGAELQLARVWENVPRYYEIKLKNRGGAKKHCPICKANHNGL